MRAAGPALASFGVAGTLAAPRLRLESADGRVLAENSGWAGAGALATAFAQAGAFPFPAGSADAAAVITLAPGNYTVQVADAANGSGGVALAEIYDLGAPTSDSRLVNVSTRATVAPGGELISGFVLAGTAPRQFLVRGVGPGLSSLGVNGALADPAVSVFDSAGRTLASNDDWNGVVSSSGMTTGAAGSVTSGANAALAGPLLIAGYSTGAFPLELGSPDAALLTALAPGAYTVQLFGKASSPPGTALLEIYEVPTQEFLPSP